MQLKSLTMSLFLLLSSVWVVSQEQSSKIFGVKYRVGSGVLDTAFVDNAENLSAIINYLETIKNDKDTEMVRVEFCGTTSPEGSFNVNRKHAANRCNSLQNYILSRTDIPAGKISYCDDSKFIDYAYLADIVEKSDMPHKEEAVDVLRNVPEFTYNEKGELVDSKKKHLMELQWGRTWYYMLDNFFSQIRQSTVNIITRPKEKARNMEEVKDKYGNDESETGDDESLRKSRTNAPGTDNNGDSDGEKPIYGISPSDSTVVVIPDAVPAVDRDEELGFLEQPKVKKPFYMALKTNLIYDALTIPNAGIEFYLGKNWSIMGNYTHGWWKNDRKAIYMRIYGGDIAVRYWFGRKAKEKPLTGHHLGLYGYILTYDFIFGHTGYMGGQPKGALWDEPSYAAGVEYGYSLPVAKRLNIDFVIGVGYQGGKYYVYKAVDDEYVWQATKLRHWFGPTKAEVSLVWLLGHDNINKNLKKDRKKNKSNTYKGNTYKYKQGGK